MQAYMFKAHLKNTLKNDEKCSLHFWYVPHLKTVVIIYIYIYHIILLLLFIYYYFYILLLLLLLFIFIIIVIYILLFIYIIISIYILLLLYIYYFSIYIIYIYIYYILGMPTLRAENAVGHSLLSLESWSKGRFGSNCSTEWFELCVWAFY